MANLPSTFYDDLANASLPVVTAPAGTYTMITRAYIGRSNVTVNFSGCIIEADPNTATWSNEFYPFQITSGTKTDEIFDESPGGTDRIDSGLTGTVTAATTQLTMLSGEVPTGLSVGETVMLLLGIDTSDPVEPYIYRAATIAAIDGLVLTFEEPLGVDVPDYVDQAGLEAEVDESLWDKIGDWGEWYGDSNYKKGYGTSHGMQRFVGGMVGNVTINDLTMNLTFNDNPSTLPNGKWTLSCYAVRGVKINRYTTNNPTGNNLHLFKSFDVEVNDYVVTGEGYDETGSLLAACNAVGIWGGDKLTFNNTSIHATNVTFIAEEVGTSGILINGMDFDVTFTSARTYPSQSVILNFTSVIDVPVVRNSTWKAVTTGGSSHGWDSFSPIKYTGRLKYIGPSLTTTFDFDNLKNPDWSAIDSVQIGNYAYGPLQSISQSVTLIDDGVIDDVEIPGIVLKVARFRITTLGDLRDITDSFGNPYWSAATSGGAPYPWVSLEPGKWHQILSGASALSDYIAKKLRFWFNGGGTNNAVIDIEYQYLPRRPLKKFVS